VWPSRGRPPNQLAGIGFIAQGNDRCSGYRRTAASRDARARFIFEGIEDEVVGDFGVLQGGAAGFELDAYDPEAGSPPHALVVASSFDHSSTYELDFPAGAYFEQLAADPSAEPIRADMVFFETPSGGAVFSVGSIAFCNALSWNGYDNNLARLCDNVLGRFRDPAAFAMPG
jgi:N,N-dimethylformamidase